MVSGRVGRERVNESDCETNEANLDKKCSMNFFLA